MTAGGTGKTPFVEYLLGLLLGKGYAPAVVSRGYGRETRGVQVVSAHGKVLLGAREAGDEPLQIAKKFPGVSVVVGERRVEAAREAIDRCGADVIVMDDGFQHRYLRRGLDILVMDARRDIRKERLLPAGTRREWLKGIDRADLLVFSRSSGVEPPAWAEGLRGVREGKALTLKHRIGGFFSVRDRAPVLPAGPVFAFSGIGDHHLFTGNLRDRGLIVAGERRFPDHHFYSAGDLASIAALAGASTIVTTEKDAARLEGVALPEGLSGMQYAVLELEVLGGGPTLERMLDTILPWTPKP
jgi:tetraacyldisaccharide 4'-kinase